MDERTVRLRARDCKQPASPLNRRSIRVVRETAEAWVTERASYPKFAWELDPDPDPATQAALDAAATIEAFYQAAASGLRGA